MRPRSRNVGTIGNMSLTVFPPQDLLLDWRKGEKYFMQMLVDGDVRYRLLFLPLLPSFPSGSIHLPQAPSTDRFTSQTARQQQRRVAMERKSTLRSCLLCYRLLCFPFFADLSLRLHLSSAVVHWNRSNSLLSVSMLPVRLKACPDASRVSQSESSIPPLSRKRSTPTGPTSATGCLSLSPSRAKVRRFSPMVVENK